MASLRVILTFFACFTVTLWAYPQGSSSHSLRLRSQVFDCPAGTLFYSCAHGFHGCASSNPCLIRRQPPSNISIPDCTAAPSNTTTDSSSVPTWIPITNTSDNVTISTSIPKYTNTTKSSTSTLFTTTPSLPSGNDPILTFTSFTTLIPTTQATSQLFSHISSILSTLPDNQTTTSFPMTTTRSITISSPATTSDYSTTAPTPTGVPLCSTTGPKAELSGPSMFNINPLKADQSQKAVNFLRLQSQSARIEHEQVAFFGTVPSNVSTCSLKWIQADADERTWVMNGNGRVQFTQLMGFDPDQPVSWNSIKLLKTSATLFTDFANFDQIDTASSHQIGDRFPCSGPVAFKLQMDRENGAGNLFMEQDKQDGLVLEYSC